MRRDQFNAASIKSLPQWVGIVGSVGNHPFRSAAWAAASPTGDFHLVERGYRERDLRWRSARQFRSQWNALAIDQYHPLGPLAPLGFCQLQRLFWQRQSRRPGTSRPSPAVDDGSKLPTVDAKPRSIPLVLPMVSTAASRSTRSDIHAEDLASGPYCARPTEFLPRTPGSPPRAFLARPLAASVGATIPGSVPSRMLLATPTRHPQKKYLC